MMRFIFANEFVIRWKETERWREEAEKREREREKGMNGSKWK